MLRLATASLAGTAIEFYDFFVYGTAAALVLGPLFFPTFSPLAGTLAAFATFGSGSSPGRWAPCCSGTSGTGTAGVRSSSPRCC